MLQKAGVRLIPTPVLLQQMSFSSLLIRESAQIVTPKMD